MRIEFHRPGQRLHCRLLGVGGGGGMARAAEQLQHPVEFRDPEPVEIRGVVRFLHGGLPEKAAGVGEAFAVPVCKGRLEFRRTRNRRRPASGAPGMEGGGGQPD